ncbi:uncharacterized protein UV8b_07191 [Ustilaginoidea virens]|uniref:Carboxypeptidase M14A n=1 Tax=Ustilaginoidea virens TaxID=1159556 RepID=A0A8E5HX07_USTVR|nr:uncharacterized protein UV8b_07191 [Ustilaginoidea virens]QUC22950.1 hypothetical protein UV8b_07191 [Ustilaginoidea virens]
MKVALLVASLLSTTAAGAVRPKASYDGHKVFRVPVADDGSNIRSVIKKLGLVTWKPPGRKGAFADIQVPPAQLDSFHDSMKGHQLITMHDDLGKSIEREGAFQAYSAGSANRTWFESYHAYSDHVQWLSDLASRYPKMSKLVSSGNSLQGNPIPGLHIFGRSGPGKKPAVVFHGTVHAREWIASMAVEYMMSELVTNYGSDTSITAFVDKYDFYLFPIVNVDGFKHSQTVDRLWRKNLQPNPGSSCRGHDINRNWDYKWGGQGASPNPCGDDYGGEKPADAPETRALAAFLHGVKAAQGLKLYIDYHSYGQLFMTPYGYSCSARARNDNELQSLAKGAVDAIYAVNKVKFDHGPICNIIYQATGSSVDYVADVVGADYTFASELRDMGEHGFILPPEQIVPSAKEAFAGAAYLLQHMK